MDRPKVQADFTPQQIVCLEATAVQSGSLGDRCLYAAVIQFIEQQQNYWLRPLCLVEWFEGRSQVISLHRTSDLIIAPHKIRGAWDTEILEFWSALYDDSGEYHDNVSGRAALHQFLQNFPW